MAILGIFFGRDYVRAGDLHFQKGNLDKAAELYLKAKRYEQAARIFDQIGQTDRAVEVYRKAGLHLQAGELLAAKGRVTQAIQLFEEAGAYRQAAEACLSLRHLVRAGRLFERAGIFRRAAECFLEAGEATHALRAWESESAELKGQLASASDPVLERKIQRLDLRRADLAAKLGRHAEAGQVLFELGMPERAARLLERAGLFDDAAKAHLAAGDPETALQVAGKAETVDDAVLAEIYRRGGQLTEAGDVYLRLGQRSEAAQVYEEAGALAKAAAIWEEDDEPLRAAQLFSEASQPHEAGRCYAVAGEHRSAAESFGQAGDLQAAGDAYLAAEDPLRAAEAYVEAGLDAAAREVLDEIPEESPDFAAATLLVLPIQLRHGRIEEARERLGRIEESGDTAVVSELELTYWGGRIAEEEGRWERAAECYRRVGDQQKGFRDVESRFALVRRKLESASGDLSGERPGTDLDPLVAEADGGPTERSTEMAALPFTIAESLTPWWGSTELERAVDQRRQQPVLLLSVPLPCEEEDEVRRATTPFIGLEHPAILGLREVISTADRLLLLYEPFEGAPLASWLGQERAAPMAAVGLLSQLFDGLATVHKLGLAHRRVSPATVLIDNVRAKLAGFGLEAILGEQQVGYAPPEKAAGPAADVYSLGLLGVELLQASLPAQRKRGAPDPSRVEWPEEVAEAVPTGVRNLLVRCLAETPVNRPSAEELKAALAGVGLAPGQILAGRYEILGELGQGGMSRVYRARDRDLEDEVAIKTVVSAIGRSEEEERLLREVQICRRITHPNVVRVHDFGRFPGGIFVIMELLDGPGLDEVIRREAPLDLQEARRLLTEIAAALSEAHRLKIVHRDLKPGNVMLVEGRVKVMDFGIAYTAESAHLTRTGQVVGSPLYMAPEQIQGKPVDGRCDLYALGIIAYTLLAGREPFVGETTTAVVLKHLHEAPPDIAEFRPELPEAWLGLLDRLLAKRPEDRFGTAEEVAEALGKLPEE